MGGDEGGGGGNLVPFTKIVCTPHRHYTHNISERAFHYSVDMEKQSPLPSICVCVQYYSLVSPVYHMMGHELYYNTRIFLILNPINNLHENIDG